MVVRWAWPTGQSYGANMAGTLEAFMDMERSLIEWVDLTLQPSPASSRNPNPPFLRDNSSPQLLR